MAAQAQMPGIPPVSDDRPQKSADLPPFFAATSGQPPTEMPRTAETQTFPYADRPLRDPFWAVGYFPAEWGAKLEPEKQKTSASEWRIPKSQIEISGVSSMGSRVVAIINGELKKVGDIVEISYLGKIFQWKVSEIQADGNVSFERYQIINDTPVNRSIP